MTFFKIMNTKINPFMNNSILRYSHRHSLPNFQNTIIPNNIIINLLGSQKFVDEASWEIKTFAVEKSLSTANIVYDTGILQNLLLKNNYFIVNRCYNISCQELLYLQHNILKNNNDWKIYNLCVFPNATNRFNTNVYIRNNKQLNVIIYPLAAQIENKRRDIHILIDN